MKKNNLLCIFFVSLIFVACNDKNVQATEEFYSNTGGFDMARIPLVKPWEAVVASTGKKSWLIRIANNEMLVTIPGVNGVRVLNNVIFVYSQNTVVNYQPSLEGWFIILPLEKRIESFSKKEDYKNWLKRHLINEPQSLYAPDKIFIQWKNNRSINWNDDNLKGI